MAKIGFIKKRKDYLAVASCGKKWVTPSFILQARSWKESESLEKNACNKTRIRLGITASKKTGNAVRRNRIRRRLKALACHFLPLWCKENYDIVIIARYSIWDKSYEELQHDLLKALKKLDLLKAENTG